MIAAGDSLRMLQFRDVCLQTGGLSMYVGELFDALANDDLQAAQRAAAAYIEEWAISKHAAREAVASWQASRWPGR